MQPWYHETVGPLLVNKWTVTHVAWGVASVKYVDSFWLALGLHTLYEMVEGGIFPLPHRDVSMLNHVGDSLAFVVGRLVGERMAL